MQLQGLNEVEVGRRAGSRRSACQEVCLFDDSGEPFMLETLDFGPKGMFVCSDVLLEPGLDLWVSFTVPSGPKLVVRGKVVHGHLGGDGRPSGMGIDFVDLTSREENWLRRFSTSAVSESKKSPWELES